MRDPFRRTLSNARDPNPLAAQPARPVGALPLLLAAALNIGLAASSRGAPILVEGFADVASLPGWSIVNNSNPVGTTGWFQGNSLIFASESGALNAYIAADFRNTTVGGSISNWLIMPELSLGNGASLSFFARGNPSGLFPDAFEVRYSNTGADVGATDTSVGDFTALLLQGSFPVDPGDWVAFVVGLPAGAARVAFRYVVADTTASGDYFGIDSVVVDDGDINSVPEPAALTLLGAALAVLGTRRRKRRQLVRFEAAGS